MLRFVALAALCLFSTAVQCSAAVPTEGWAVEKKAAVAVNWGGHAGFSADADGGVDLAQRLEPLHSHTLDVLSAVVGWGYFAAWSLSFYPQVYENWRRKSVVGLSFDFLLLNITGFVCYSVYNVSIFWVQPVQVQYLSVHGGNVPVKINDIVFALHAVALVIITGVQCFIYERGNQRVSWPAAIISGFMWISILLVVLLGLFSMQRVVTWLFVVNWLSYIKVAVTVLKYMPQAYMNFKRKSTVGWSIGNVLLDFTGGTLSFAQLFIDSVNAGTFIGFYGDIAKTLLSVFSLAFDVLFMLQHYCCYRRRKDPHSKVLLHAESEDDDKAIEGDWSNDKKPLLAPSSWEKGASVNAHP